MFSGIIEQTGRVEWLLDLASGNDIGLQIKVVCDPNAWQHSANFLPHSPEVGESIAVDGVCLTAIKWMADGFVAELSPETLKVAKPYFYINEPDSSVPKYTAIAPVNLERAMRYGQLVGGHLVSGHVDGIGTVINIAKTESFWNYTLKVASGMECSMVAKGCIAINGISLTVNSVIDNVFTVMIIPHTLNHSNLKYLQVGSPVNLESDLMAKYVIKARGRIAGDG